MGSMCTAAMWGQVGRSRVGAGFVGSCEGYAGRGPVVFGAGNWLLMLELPVMFVSDLVSLK